jgi:hypothetical protein
MDDIKTSVKIVSVVALGFLAPVAYGAELKVKVLSPAVDAARTTVLIGRTSADLVQYLGNILER